MHGHFVLTTLLFKSLHKTAQAITKLLLAYLIVLVQTRKKSTVSVVPQDLNFPANHFACPVNALDATLAVSCSSHSSMYIILQVTDLGIFFNFSYKVGEKMSQSLSFINN